jgi:hypothetical protein
MAAHSANAQAVKKATGTDSANITMVVRIATLSGWRAASGASGRNRPARMTSRLINTRQDHAVTWTST